MQHLKLINCASFLYLLHPSYLSKHFKNEVNTFYERNFLMMNEMNITSYCLWPFCKPLILVCTFTHLPKSAFYLHFEPDGSFANNAYF